jgi:hypothetical protein
MPQRRKNGLLRRFAPRNDGKHTFAPSRREASEALHEISRPIEGVGTPDARCSRSLAYALHWKKAHEDQKKTTFPMSQSIFESKLEGVVSPRGNDVEADAIRSCDAMASSAISSSQNMRASSRADSVAKPLQDQQRLGGRLACWLLARKLTSTAAGF